MEGVAEEARRVQAIKAAHRTGRGEWYAVVEAFRLEGDSIIANLTTAHEKCASRKQAIEAGRRLLAKKAEWLDEETRIEVAIYSALEWRPEAL